MSRSCRGAVAVLQSGWACAQTVISRLSTDPTAGRAREPRRTAAAATPQSRGCVDRWIALGRGVCCLSATADSNAATNGPTRSASRPPSTACWRSVAHRRSIDSVAVPLHCRPLLCSTRLILHPPPAALPPHHIPPDLPGPLSAAAAVGRRAPWPIRLMSLRITRTAQIRSISLRRSRERKSMTQTIVRPSTETSAAAAAGGRVSPARRRRRRSCSHRTANLRSDSVLIDVCACREGEMLRIECSNARSVLQLRAARLLAAAACGIATQPLRYCSCSLSFSLLSIRLASHLCV